jgi:hypothetical protein
MKLYLIRVNGNTAHNNPHDAAHFVDGEPPNYPNTYYNFLSSCFAKNIVRIGWPNVGDLQSPGVGALPTGYKLNSVKPYVKKYLETFRDIPVGSIVLVPNGDISGDIYIAEVTEPYHYFHNPPADPYEHSHRLGVRWDRDENGVPILYHAEQLGINVRGGLWRRAFGVVTNPLIISKVKDTRKDKPLPEAG